MNFLLLVSKTSIFNNFVVFNIEIKSIINYLE